MRSKEGYNIITIDAQKLIADLETTKQNSKEFGYNYVLLSYHKISDIQHTLQFFVDRWEGC